MAFFEDLGKKISEAAEIAAEKAKDFAGDAADKAKDIAEIARLNNDIFSEQKQMDKEYIKLGKAVYEQEKENTQSSFNEEISKIKKHQSNIAGYQKKLQEIKDKDNTTPPGSTTGNDTKDQDKEKEKDEEDNYIQLRP